MEAPRPRTIPKDGEIPSPGFKEVVALGHLLSLVCFFLGSGATTGSFPLGLSLGLRFLLGEQEGSSLQYFFPITTPLMGVDFFAKLSPLAFSTFSL